MTRVVPDPTNPRREIVYGEPEYRHTAKGLTWPHWQVNKFKPAQSLPVGRSLVRELRKPR